MKALFLNKQNAIERMNDMGKKQKAFFFAIDFELENCLVLTPEEARKENILYAIGEKSNAAQKPRSTVKTTHIRISPPSFESYREAFQKVKNELEFGNSYLTNLTFKSAIKTDMAATDIFHYSRAPYKVLLPGHFIVFSPERFVRINQQGGIFSHPMKGTIDAAIPDAANIILRDSKEMAEHNTIVDLIRNDLSRIAEKVRVKRFRYIDHLKTSRKNLLQVSSEISGQLPGNWKNELGTLFFRLLPAGSISGAPKHKTLEIIREAEKSKRGFYTGTCGYFDGKGFDSGVMIRFIEMTDGQLFYRSGGGITVNSNVHSEYEEMIDKIYVPFS